MVFFSSCFQAFVHPIMGLQWISLVNQVSVMEDVTSLIHPTVFRMVKWVVETQTHTYFRSRNHS